MTSLGGKNVQSRRVSTIPFYRLLPFRNLSRLTFNSKYSITSLEDSILVVWDIHALLSMEGK